MFILTMKRNRGPLNLFKLAKRYYLRQVQVVIISNFRHTVIFGNIFLFQSDNRPINVSEFPYCTYNVRHTSLWEIIFFKRQFVKKKHIS